MSIEVRHLSERSLCLLINNNIQSVNILASLIFNLEIQFQIIIYAPRVRYGAILLRPIKNRRNKVFISISFSRCECNEENYIKINLYE